MFWLQVVIAGLVVVGSYVGLGVLTALGQRRRGGGVLAVATAILFFPVHWVAWYAGDARPFFGRVSERG